MSKMISASEKMSKEYCCTLVQIGEVKPIEGSDFLGVTMVEGREIVVRKDQVKEGDVMFYVSNECQLASAFLSKNNMFEDVDLNANAEEVLKELESFDRSISLCKSDEAGDKAAEDLINKRKAYLQAHKGYFNRHGRVRMVKLRGVLSMGFLFSEKEMKTYCPEFKMEDVELHEDFDTVNGELFVQAYVPPVKEGTPRGSKDKKRNKKLARFDRMIPGQFAFHYDTNQLNREMYRIKPDDKVFISVKLHGTSFISGRVKTNAPRWGGLYEKIFLYLPKFLRFTKEVYDNVYSSRTVIKNQYINDKATSGFYNKDVWATYADILKPYIPEGTVIYGEICGYVDGTSTMIQKGFDYGCKPGENMLMIYRITKQTENGKRELGVDEILEATHELLDTMVQKNDENWKKIHPIDVLYSGTLRELYPELDVENHWHEAVLEKLKNEKRFGMEEMEPLCKNRVPREGFVLRIANDPINEAFKLKCLKFLDKEAKEIDSGVSNDIEMAERYS